MKKTLILIVTVALFCINLAGQTKTFEDLKLTLSPVQPQVLPLEPVSFNVELANNTEVPVTVETSSSFRNGYIKLEVKKPDGMVVVPQQLSPMNGQSFVFSQEIQPGKKRESIERFTLRVHEIFGQPGEYQIRASLKNSDGKTVRSEWANLTISQPSERDRDAFERILQKIDASSLESLSFDRWTTEELEEFVSLYSEIRYANYARYILGLRLEDSQPERAATYLRKIDKEFIFFEIVNDRLRKLEQRN